MYKNTSSFKLHLVSLEVDIWFMSLDNWYAYFRTNITNIVKNVS